MEKQGYREAYERLNNMFPDKAAISVKEAAKALGVSEDIVRKDIKKVRNPFPHQKIGGRVIIPITQLARWMC